MLEASNALTIDYNARLNWIAHSLPYLTQPVLQAPTISSTPVCLDITLAALGFKQRLTQRKRPVAFTL